MLSIIHIKPYPMWHTFLIDYISCKEEWSNDDESIWYFLQKEFVYICLSNHFFLLNIITKDKQLKLISYFVSFYRFNILCDRSFIRVF